MTNFSIKKLIKGIKNKSGRNNLGRITIQGKSKRHKRYFRYIFHNIFKYKGYILQIQKDPNRSSSISLIGLHNYWLFFLPKIFIYKLTTNKDFIGKLLCNYSSNQLNKLNLKFLGDSFLMINCEKNDIICNLQSNLQRKSNIAKAAGSFCTFLKVEESSNKVLIKLPSQSTLKVNYKSYITLGKISINLKTIKYKKAGMSSWLGIKSKVRGVAKNPVDHPHGGGNGKGKGRIAVTPYGKLTKCKKTKKKK
jgi:large subunit ribosomal protein L2